MVYETQSHAFFLYENAKVVYDSYQFICWLIFYMLVSTTGSFHIWCCEIWGKLVTGLGLGLEEVRKMIWILETYFESFTHLSFLVPTFGFFFFFIL